MKKVLFFFILSAGIMTACGPGNQESGPAHDRHTPSDSLRQNDTDPKNDPVPSKDTSEASGSVYGRYWSGNNS